MSEIGMEIDGFDIGELPEVVTRERWLDARRELLVREKELTRLRTQLDADRRRLPMVEIDKSYVFEGPSGPAGLLDLFAGRRQLIVHHFMWTYDVGADGTETPRDTGCSSCSTQADAIPRLRQLHVRNTSLVGVSRAPYEKIASYRERMGWTFPWYSSWDSDFNIDFHATLDERLAPVLFGYRTQDELAAAGTPWSPGMRGEWPGLSAFLRVGDRVFHTYSTFGRGLEPTWALSQYLDLTALGRQEAWEEPKGRAAPLGLHAGGPNLRLPDEYDVPGW